MITCRLQGLFGNNLFQIANLINKAKKINTNFVLPTHTIAGHRGLVPVDLSFFSYKYVQENISLPIGYEEKEYHFVDYSIENNTCIHGFFSSWKYFENIKDELINIFFKPNDIVEEKINNLVINKNSLGIIVRRGDYLMLQDNHCVLSTKYFEEALEMIYNRYGEEIQDVYVISDDIEWCKKVFPSEVKIIDDRYFIQFFAMTKMDYLIIPNSTFAWWATYLNKNVKMVICPDPWFGKNYSTWNTDDLYYPNWIKLQHKIEYESYIPTENMFKLF